MSKYCFVAAVAFLGLDCSATASLAQCANADLCTVQECTTRQAQVHPTCDQPRSCANIASSNKAELRNRLSINQQCLAARLNVASCFSTSDTGHDQQIAQIRTSIQVCQNKITQN